MPKIMFIGDLHIGCRNDSPDFREYQRAVFNDIFSIIDENNVDVVVQLGDVLDKRSSINFLTSSFLFETLSKFDRMCEFHSLIGNHDAFYKTSNSVCGVKQFERMFKNVHMHDKPCTLTYGDTKLTLIPWICQDSEAECLKFMESASTDCAYSILCGHFEIKGFRMQGTTVSEIGMEPSAVMGKANAVISGHFHTPSKRGSIEYIGVPFELNWNDYGNVKKVKIYDTDTHEFMDIQLHRTMHEVLTYRDDMSIAEAEKCCSNLNANGKIRLVLKSAPKSDTNVDYMVKYLTNTFSTKSCEVVDQYSEHQNMEDDMSDVHVKSTLDALITAVSEVPTSDKTESEFLVSEIMRIYDEAVSISANV